jgi:signal transduction histidine kinase
VDSIIEEGLQTTAYIPLSTKGELMGVMCASSHYPVELADGYIEFLTAIGNQIGVAVDNANLYENIKSAYEDLKNAQEQIVQTEKLASLGKLAATIAHEINNPLAAVLTYIRLMIKLIDLNRFSPERLEDISRYLATMESETERCGEIVKNLLAFSRQSKITMKRISIVDIIDKSLALIAHDLEIKGIQLKKNIDPHLPKVQCDFQQIQQALLNLMYNASDAMLDGGTLTVTANKKAETERFLEVAVSDTGCGITGEDKEKIFDPFFTTKEEGKGVGLGLSVVYGIITRHNGTIEVESEPGKGSTFKIRLPIAPL